MIINQEDPLTVGAATALYGFILERDDSKRMESFNSMLHIVEINAKLYRNDGVVTWSSNCPTEIDWAEEFFSDLIQLENPFNIQSYIEAGRIGSLLQKYENFLRDTKRRIETLRIISEFENR